MGDDVRYWLVAEAGLTPETLPAYLAQGRWVSKNPAGHAHQLAEMRPGDRIALKTVRTVSSGLPFFNADRNVSAMTIQAVGTVQSVDPAAGTVVIAWDPDYQSRDWYMFTHLKALSRISGTSHRLAQPLIDFIFHGAAQDIDYLLRADSYWSRLYPAPPGFTWVPWYEEFATALQRYRGDRGPLVAAVLELADSEPLLKQLQADAYADGSTGPVRDLDPFTLFSTFNRGLTTANRVRLIGLLGKRLGIGSPVPQDFDGIPVANNQRSWFVRYERRRDPGDIDALWRIFGAALALAGDDTPAARAEFVSAFDAAQQVSGVRWNLTMGLYWVRPTAFPTLDGRSREFNHQHFGIGAALDGAGYLAVRDQLQQRMAAGGTSITSFPLLSFAAWSDSTMVWPGHTMEGLAAWGARVAESVDLDEIEHDYKRATADLLADAKQQIEAGDPAWTETFRQAMNSTNTIDFRFKSDLRRATDADPDAMADLLQQVWADPRPAALDGLRDGLSVVLGGTVTPGNATALGATLLTAVDTEGNAPYSTTRVEKWRRLSGTEPLGWTESPSRRYADMLAFLDALAGQLEQQFGERPTVLETQGIAWATTENEIPAEWSESERKALQAWRSNAAVEPPRAWLVRAKQADVEVWLDDGYVALAATNLPDVPPGADEKTVRAAVESGYQHVDYAQRQVLSAEYYAFLTRMKPGDLVAVPHDTTVHVGVVEGEARYVEGVGDRLRRNVAWRAETEPDEVALADLRGLQGTVVDITAGFDRLAALVEKDVGPDPPPPDVVPALPPITTQLAAALHMPVEALQAIVDLLQSRQQIVLYGPPGTGKTFLAMALAEHLVGTEDGSRARLVQFHPSYAYEDFFEGFRPRETESGQATFELTPGPLRRIASDAEADPGTPYVLVIDELNRANLAKVFGELYFLLEYRNRRIHLQYNPGELFRLPKNLFLIGTMNTADRSIALLDAAMRRRFSFVELHPDEPPVRGVLATWLAAQGHDDERARLLAALNAAIEEQDRDLRIGPSYLMRAEAATPEGLARVWKYDIMPLLEEHYYGRLSREQIQHRFGLDALRRGLAGAGQPEGEDLPEDDFA